MPYRRHRVTEHYGIVRIVGCGGTQRPILAIGRGHYSEARRISSADKAQVAGSLGEPERWRDLAHREISSSVLRHPLHPGPMATKNSLLIV